MSRLAAEEEFAGGVGVEVGADLEEPLDGLGSTLHHRADRGRIAETGAGGERVLDVEIGGVVFADRGGETALGVAGVGLAEHAFGEEGDAETGWQAQGEGQSGDAGANDDDVVGVGILGGEA